MPFDLRTSLGELAWQRDIPRSDAPASHVGREAWSRDSNQGQEPGLERPSFAVRSRARRCAASRSLPVAVDQGLVAVAGDFGDNGGYFGCGKRRVEPCDVCLEPGSQHHLRPALTCCQLAAGRDHLALHDRPADVGQTVQANVFEAAFLLSLHSPGIPLGQPPPNGCQRWLRREGLGTPSSPKLPGGVSESLSRICPLL